MVVLRTFLIGGLLALIVAAPAGAQTTTLMPGVTYEQSIQFTPHGPVAMHVVIGPGPRSLRAAPGALERVDPGAREGHGDAEAALLTATMVGINGDFYAPDTGRPSGVLMRDGIVDSPPSGDRSSVGLSPEGAIDVRRVEFFGTWRGLGQRRTLTDMNQAPKQNAISLFTPSYGASTPAQAGVSEIILQPFPPAVPNTDLTGTVVGFSGVGGTAIPRDGAVLVARGTAAERLVAEAPVGSTVTIRMILRPDWTGIPNAVGGGPVIVRNGGPVFRANEAFSSYQLAPRHPRTAVGQLADGGC